MDNLLVRKKLRKQLRTSYGGRGVDHGSVSNPYGELGHAPSQEHLASIPRTASETGIRVKKNNLVKEDRAKLKTSKGTRKAGAGARTGNLLEAFDSGSEQDSKETQAKAVALVVEAPKEAQQRPKGRADPFALDL